MKRTNKYIFFLLIVCLLTLCSCGSKKPQEIDVPMEQSDLNISSEIPSKVEYLRRWEYGADYETQDQNVMMRLVLALQKVKLKSNVEYRVDDYTDIIILHYADGKQVLVELEEQNIIIDENPIGASGLDDVRLILSEIAGD